MELKFDISKLKIVDTDEVRPNSWNPKAKDTRQYKKIKKGLSMKGLRLPIVVRENKGYEIIDGEQRWTACKELKFPKVIIYNEGKIPDKDAKELTIWYQQQVPFKELDLAILIKDLASYPDLQLPFTKEEIQEYIKLFEFDWEIYNYEINLEEVDKKYNFKVTDEQLKAIKRICKEQHGGIDLTAKVIRRITITKAQKEIVERALAKIKTEEGENREGRALELICADFLAGR